MINNSAKNACLYSATILSMALLLGCGDLEAPLGYSRATACAELEGDATCSSEHGPDRGYCSSIEIGCPGARSREGSDDGIADGCVASVPPEECYQPCGASECEPIGAPATEPDIPDEPTTGDPDDGPSGQTCGDGHKDEFEECDDGNAINNDGCTNACTLPVCGDGIVQRGFGEECDNGRVPDGRCSLTCRKPGSEIWSVALSALHIGQGMIGQAVALGNDGTVGVVARTSDRDYVGVALSEDGETVLWADQLFDTTWQIAAGPNGSFVVVGDDGSNAQIRAYHQDGRVAWRSSSPCPRSSYRDVAVDAEGRAWAVGFCRGPVVDIYDINGDLVETEQGEGAGWYQAVNITAGGVWVMGRNKNRAEVVWGSRPDDWQWTSETMNLGDFEPAYFSVDNIGSTYVRTTGRDEGPRMAKFGPDGVTLWTRTELGGVVGPIAALREGNLVVIAGKIAPAASLSLYDSDGERLSQRVYLDDAASRWFEDLVVGPDNEVVAVGGHRNADDELSLYIVKASM